MRRWDHLGAMRFFLDRGVDTFVLKMSEQGYYVGTSDSELTIPAFKINVIHDYSAGDS